jgi:hypothetical protein
VRGDPGPFWDRANVGFAFGIAAVGWTIYLLLDQAEQPSIGFVCGVFFVDISIISLGYRKYISSA